MTTPAPQQDQHWSTQSPTSNVANLSIMPRGGVKLPSLQELGVSSSQQSYSQPERPLSVILPSDGEVEETRPSKRQNVSQDMVSSGNAKGSTASTTTTVRTQESTAASTNSTAIVKTKVPKKRMKQPLSNDGQATPGRGRSKGALKYTDAEDIRMVDIWWDKLPVGQRERAACVQMYNVWAKAHGYSERKERAVPQRISAVCNPPPLFSPPFTISNLIIIYHRS